ncbi:MAG: LLM class flavin-dependent oxidoreductase [Chloroflexi bacterium]|nr:LLM class flavin-dependent oxidoreductase [Chloroflexota bacterium]MDA1270787.1 LLM class flavin-dependent oxidoreductase [Chloroflexota bacterium]
MHYGLVMECDYRYGHSQEEAFDEAFAMAEAAENGGLDGVWLAERHFAAPKDPLDPMGGGIPSVVSSPLIISTAIVARTERLRVGVAVNVLPLSHPVRMAEEIATLDQISHGRVDFGVGRSGFMRAYEGYDIPYAESRERFQENLDIILAAWTNERFSYQGKNYNFNEVCVIPKPYQQPHPPLRMAATTKETFPQVGRLGYPIFVGLRGLDRPDLVKLLNEYRKAWKDAGHAGNGDVFLRIPIYVGASQQEAYADAEESAMRSYRRMAQNFAASASAAGAVVSEDRAARGQALSAVTYEQLIRDRLAYGDPEGVATQLKEISEELGLSGIVAETNVGGLIPREKVTESIRLFCKEVVPALR